MFENTNKALPIEIARETMKAHRLRNIMACLAIILTTTLIMVVCGAGISTIDAIMTESGHGISGIGIYGDIEILDKMREQSGVEWADIARPCMQGTPRNKEFAGNVVKFSGVDKEYYEHHDINLISGNYPQNEHELLISDSIAQKTGRKMTPGQKIILNLVVLKDNIQQEKAVEMTICGFYANPSERLADHEEIYTSKNFPDIYNPELNDTASIIYVKFKDLTDFTSLEKIEEKLSDLNRAVKGNGIIMDLSGDVEEEIVNTIALLLLIMVCGFLLIHNIFRISVVNDIRFIGNMKIIGMTKRQIGAMLRWQVRRLGAAGIIVGSALGTGLNFFVIRLFQSMDFSYARYYELGKSLVVSVIAGMVFSVVTLWVSSRTAVSLARKVSPVAASRFRSSGRKKKIFSAISFALGGILFCTIFTVFAGYDTEWMVDSRNETDFVIQQYHSLQPMYEPYDPLDGKLIQSIRELDFVKDSYLFYRARSERTNKADAEGLYIDSLGEVKFDGHYKDVMVKEFEKMAYIKEDWDIFVQDGRANTGILGMEAAALGMEGNNVEILDGELNADLFATGKYLIYMPFAIPENVSAKEYLEYGMKAGDEVTFSFWNSELGQYKTKTFTVMAVVQRKADNYAGEMCSGGIQLVMENSIFEEVYGDSAKKMISSLRMNTLGRNARMEQETIEQLLADHFNSQVQVNSRYKMRQDQKSIQRQELFIGILFGLITAFIGLANIINTVITDVLSRKLEFAVMQSIGMTKRQMASEICQEGMKMILISFLPVCLLSFFSARALASLIYVKYVSYMYVVSCILILLLGLFTACITGCILTRSLNKKTVVERLREIE